VQKQKGRFPQSESELRALPGIGPYTAGAIASFAFEQPAAIVEANTQRLYARLLAVPCDPRSTVGQQTLWQFATHLVFIGQSAGLSPSAINQGLMDLGATVCRPGQPLCDVCPVRRWCAAAQTGQQLTLPVQRPRPAVTSVTEATVGIRQGECYLLRQRTVKERWAGLWDFPRFPVAENAPREEVHSVVMEQTGLRVELGEQVAQFRHGVTRYQITLQCYIARAAGGTLRTDQMFAWVPPAEFANYPLSVTARKFARLLSESLFSKNDD
jgi:A/G-specific adenine glycosylase